MLEVLSFFGQPNYLKLLSNVALQFLAYLFWIHIKHSFYWNIYIYIYMKYSLCISILRTYPKICFCGTFEILILYQRIFMVFPKNILINPLASVCCEKAPRLKCSTKRKNSTSSSLNLDFSYLSLSLSHKNQIGSVLPIGIFK